MRVWCASLCLVEDVTVDFQSSMLQDVDLLMSRASLARPLEFETISNKFFAEQLTYIDSVSKLFFSAHCILVTIFIACHDPCGLCTNLSFDVVLWTYAKRWNWLPPSQVCSAYAWHSSYRLMNLCDASGFWALVSIWFPYCHQNVYSVLILDIYMFTALCIVTTVFHKLDLRETVSQIQ